MVQVQGRLLGAMAVVDQPRQYINKEVSRTAMASVLDLRNVLELVNNALDHSTFAQQDLVDQQHRAVLHVLAELGDEQQPGSLPELFGQRLRDVSPVAKQLAKQMRRKRRNRLAVIDVARCELDRQQCASIVDYQVQFEAIEPAHRGLASLGQPGKDLVPQDPTVMADCQ